MGSALGVAKVAAARVGVPFDEYQQHVAAGEKWCTGCRAWHPTAAFNTDRSRGDGRSSHCRDHAARRHRLVFTPKGPPARYGPLPNPPRDGDCRQARQRVNVLVRTGRLPHPNQLPCADCGHVWSNGERRHEYDHHQGYAAQHHYDVEPVCTTCHHRREEQRGATFYTRSA